MGQPVNGPSIAAGGETSRSADPRWAFDGRFSRGSWFLFAILYGHLVADLSWTSLGACCVLAAMAGAYHHALMAPLAAVSASLLAHSDDGTVLSGVSGAMLAVATYSTVVGAELVWQRYGPAPAGSPGS